MPSKSAAQHRWIGWLHSNPAARAESGMSKAKTDEWLHADKGKPWERASGGATVRRHLMPDDQEFEEIMGRGWHAYMRNHTGDSTADPNMRQAAPPSHDSGETSRGTWFGSGADYDPAPQEHRSGGRVMRRDDGGVVDPTQGGAFTPSAATENPMAQGMIQRYSAMRPEQLQELAAKLGASPQGQIIQRILAQKRIMSAQQTQPQKRGGETKRAAGGVMSGSEASPWWTRSEARSANTGFLHGVTPGRADAVKTTAPGGAYVIPADVVAGEGAGNSLAGASSLEHMIRTGPLGVSMPRSGVGHGLPRPPAAPHAKGGNVKHGPRYGYVKKARTWVGPKLFRVGGETAPGSSPVALSDGELVIHPDDVARFGGGDHKKGVTWFDQFVMKKRKEHIEKLKKLPPPVGAKR